VCIVVGALAAQPAADDLSGASTVFVVGFMGVFCWCKRHQKMSLRKGGGASRVPRHQNSFEFRHNPKSKKTAMILGITNATQDLCPRCSAKIEWRRK
jgi:hypothetical protein